MPVMAIVVILHFTLAPLPNGQLSIFLLGGMLLIVGLAIFLLGAEIGLIPFGQKVGAALTSRRNLPLALITSFIIGFAITIAEPDVQVLTNQVKSVVPGIDKSLLLVLIAVGVGLFLVVAVLRVLFQLSLRLLLAICYLLVFTTCVFIEPGFVGIAFDSGGATTGPITVPFIMALGLGVSSVIERKGGEDDSFGFVGLASIGPIAAVAAMGLFYPVDTSVQSTTPEVQIALGLLATFLQQLPHVIKDTAFALLPLIGILAICQITMLRLPAAQIKSILLGIAYSFVGLVLFLTGVNGGFTPVGRSLGMSLAAYSDGWLLIPIGVLLGAVVVCAEPAVWVLTEQVEEVSGGYIKRCVMLASLSLSVALAVALGMFRVVTGISIWWLLIPGYALALGLTTICPKLFTAIAFDSGGVASGPMSTTFILALTLGASVALGGNPATDAFGMVAMIAMAPLITIQVLGLIFKAKEKKRNEMRVTEDTR